MSDCIEKQIDLKAPVARVWRALTDHREFGEWFRVKLEAPFVVGQEARGQITHPGYEHVTWRSTVREMQPERVFSFNWRPYAIDPTVDYSNEPQTLVRFTLESIPTGTRLVLSECGFDAIPEHRRAEAFRMNDKGWTSQMKNIEAHVAAHP
jgi:uncharacterized protein YndB with AHSA1/START domain